MPLGIAAAVQYFSSSNTPSTNPVTNAPPQSFNFVEQPATSKNIISKVMSYFGDSSGSMLSSPDIPHGQPQPTSVSGFAQPTPVNAFPANGLNALNLLTSFASGAQQSSQNLPALLPRRIQNVPPTVAAAASPVNDNGVSRFPTSTESFQAIGGISKLLLSGTVGSNDNPAQLSRDSTDNLQSLVQSASSSSLEASRGFHPSLIATGLTQIDGGMLMDMERAAASAGVVSPLNGIKLDPMSSELLKNIRSLTHYRHPEGLPPIHRDPMVPSMEDKPPLSALPVMHNVFDNDVPPDVQHAMDQSSSFKLPDVPGVPFHDIIGFN